MARVTARDRRPVLDIDQSPGRPRAAQLRDRLIGAGCGMM